MTSTDDDVSHNKRRQSFSEPQYRNYHVNQQYLHINERVSDSFAGREKIVSS